MLSAGKLPIGIQDFEDLRTNGYVYVDKTAYLYHLVNLGKPYFLGRPRRFGKSLFLSTLKAYFLGKKELFEGLAIAELEKDWTEYPVIHLDINKTIYENPQTFKNSLNVLLSEYEQFWKIDNLLEEPSLRLDKQYADICGISESELINHFQPETQTLADELGKTYEATLAELKKRYDGYHFAKQSEGMYNPFSLLNTLAKKDFNNYWFATGTPTFLVKMIKNIDFDVNRLENNVKIPADSITDYHAGYENPVPLLYQSGYLTIKEYDALFNEYTLGFPNEEVMYGFFNELFPVYMSGKDMRGEFYAANFVRDLLSGNVDGFMNRLKAFFAGILYDLNNKGEKHYQTVFFILFRLMGQFIEAEQRSASGRAAAVVITADTVFVFEFKLAENATAEEALQQINDKGYLIPYAAGNKKPVKVGVEFNKEEQDISRWFVDSCNISTESI